MKMFCFNQASPKKVGQLHQAGTTIIEFTIVASLFFVLIFALIEFSRLMFVWHGLNETSRRAARLAAVCQVSPAEQTAVKNLALMGAVPLPGLDANNILLQYLNGDGLPVIDTVADFGDIRFVRASIVNYQISLLIPALPPISTSNFSGMGAPDFTTTMRRESLGVSQTKKIPCAAP